MPHRRRLRSASTEQLDVPTCRRSTVGGRAFPAAAAKVWNGLPSDVTSASSLTVVKNRVKTYLFRRCYETVWLWITFLHYLTSRTVVLCNSFDCLGNYKNVYDDDDDDDDGDDERRPCSNRSISPVRRAHSSKPAATECGERVVGETVGRTDARPLHNSRMDYCNTVLAGAPGTVTEKLQRPLNAAARVITGTRKFDRGLGQILHDQLHWLDVTDRVLFKLALTVHQFLTHARIE